MKKTKKKKEKSGQKEKNSFTEGLKRRDAANKICKHQYKARVYVHEHRQDICQVFRRCTHT